ncbi:ribbon-helix-helix domain-containing protein [Krasilnikovia sp. MM14-A1259]|uniref:ribbon-helix-helix domain-containing protein n=1 Tax=Krasilnikovia sp. MM14-A1259 TaxID=3373539 RepID=UPI00399C97B1
MNGSPRKRGPKPGTRYGGYTPTYDPTSGKPYFTGAKFDNPDEAMKLLRAAEAAGISVAEVIRRAIRFLPIDDQGCPLWPSPESTANEQLRFELSPGQQNAA